MSLKRKPVTRGQGDEMVVQHIMKLGVPGIENNFRKLFSYEFEWLFQPIPEEGKSLYDLLLLGRDELFFPLMNRVKLQEISNWRKGFDRGWNAI